MSQTYHLTNNALLINTLINTVCVNAEFLTGLKHPPYEQVNSSHYLVGTDKMPTENVGSIRKQGILLRQSTSLAENVNFLC